MKRWFFRLTTLWFQLEDMFQLIGTPQGIEQVTVQLKETPTVQPCILDQIDHLWGLVMAQPMI